MWHIIDKDASLQHSVETPVTTHPWKGENAFTEEGGRAGPHKNLLFETPPLCTLIKYQPQEPCEQQ